MTLPNVLFLCTGNSCRSQMAEGFGHHFGKNSFTSWSAGLDPHGMNPMAMEVMQEAGVPINKQHSKHLDELKDVAFDLVVTLCGHADETCPTFPGKTRVVHVGFEDPPKLAESAGTAEEKLDCYRRVRDEIKTWIQTVESEYF